MPKLGGLPRLLWIADGFCDRRRGDRVLELMSTGLIEWVQLRDHGVDRDVYRENAMKMVEAIRRDCPATVISLNSDADLASRLGVGVHVGFRGPSPVEARSILGPTGLVGYSAHAVSELSEAGFESLDYFTVSPIYNPISKPVNRTVGLGVLSACVAATSTPVFALGGVTPDRVVECRIAGAYGVAVVGGITLADDPKAAVRMYAEAISS